MMRTHAIRFHPLLSGLAVASLLSLGLLGCSGGGSTDNTATVTVAGNVPIAYVKRADTVNLNPTDGAPFAPGGDLMLREKCVKTLPIKVFWLKWMSIGYMIIKHF